MLLNYALSEPVHSFQHLPLILLHGLFGSLDNLGMIKTAQQQHRQVLSIDLPNHGRSPHFDQFDYPLMSEKVRQLLSHLGIEKCHILGHSMGGKVAMKIALEHPNLIHSLMLADISPVQYQARHHNVLQGLSALPLNSITSRKQADNLLAQHIHEPSVRAFLLKSLDISANGVRRPKNLKRNCT